MSKKAPITQNELLLLIEHKVINMDTLLWKEKFQDWIKFSDINFESDLQQNVSSPQIPSNNLAPQSVTDRVDLNLLSIDSYYRQEFEKIISSTENYKGKWNWWAFLFGSFWCFSKGLWPLALILLLSSWFFTYLSQGLGFLYIVVWSVIVGNRGTWFFYNLKIKGKHM